MKKNWRTTLGGILAAIGIAILSPQVAPLMPEKVQQAATAIAVVGSVLMGNSAQDAKKEQ